MEKKMKRQWALAYGVLLLLAFVAWRGNKDILIFSAQNRKVTLACSFEEIKSATSESPDLLNDLLRDLKTVPVTFMTMPQNSSLDDGRALRSLDYRIMWLV